MKYNRFEVLALILGVTAVVATLFTAPLGLRVPGELVGQLLLLLPFAGAVHRGRLGGAVGAAVAVLVYAAMQLPLLHNQGLTPEIAAVLGLRVISYTLLGLAGGEACARIKYVFTRLSADCLVDQETGLYSGRYAGEAIISGVRLHERYDTAFTVVRLTLSPTLLEPLAAPRRRSLLRHLGAHLRQGVRLVDDVAHAGDGVYLLMLPKTPGDLAAVVAARLRKTAIEITGAKPAAVQVELLSVPEETARLATLAFELAPDMRSADAGDTPQGEVTCSDR